jgi:hypothetical protein
MPCGTRTIVKPLATIKLMKNPNAFLDEFLIELTQWIDKPTVNALKDVMYKIRSAVELTIVLIKEKRKVSSDEKNLFEGGAYLARYFDGWGDEFFLKYIEMVNYVKQNHY